MRRAGFILQPLAGDLETGGSLLRQRWSCIERNCTLILLDESEWAMPFDRQDLLEVGAKAASVERP
jgi:hypothetical protein